MVNAKTEITVKGFAPAAKYHLRRKNSPQRLVYVVPVVAILLGLLPYFASPEDWVLADSWGVLLGIALFFLPLWVRRTILSGLKKSPAFGTTIEWEIDEQSLRGKGTGFTMSEAWGLFVEIHVTQHGILVYPQHQLFYWLPRSGFGSEDGYREAVRCIMATSKNVTFSKDGKQLQMATFQDEESSGRL